MADEQERRHREGEGHQAEREPRPQYVTHIDTVHGTINIGSPVYGGPAPAPLPDLPDDSGYNVAAIRELLLEAFTVQQLPRFCQDRLRFRAIYRTFGPNDGLDVMVDKVIQYVSAQFLWQELLVAVQEENPNQYARFESRLRPASSAPPDPSTPPAPSALAAAPPPAELVPTAMLDALQRLVREYGPAAARPAALAQVATLRAAVTARPLDLAAVEAVFHWFDTELPALSGTLLSIVLHLGRQLKAGPDDALWFDFQQRFAAYID